MRGSSISSLFGRDNAERRRGNALLATLIVVFALSALVTAQFTVVQKNTQQSFYYSSYQSLKDYAESGIKLAFHDLQYDVTGNDGNIGTEYWTTANDLGRDGTASTNDDGEGDGIPTPGEPNVYPVSVGPSSYGIQLFAYVDDSSWSGVKRIVSRASTFDAEASVETYVRQTLTSVPRVAAVYTDPSVTLDLNGNNFTISGDDQNPDGTAGPAASTYGISTAPGDPPGTNANSFITQIGSRWDQVTGQGYDPATNTPAVGENPTDVDIDATFESLVLQKDTTLGTGTHSGVTLGTPGAQEITYCNGDLHLSGNGTGAGILLVEGDLDMSGQFEYQGLIIVRGDVRQSGGGSGTHVWGSMWITGYLTFVDDPELTMTGTADIHYSSQTLDAVDSLISSTGGSYQVVYSNQLR